MSLAFIKIDNCANNIDKECRKQPRDAMDQICAVAITITIVMLKAVIHEKDADTVKHELSIYVEEILANSEGLSQDIDKQKALTMLDWLANRFGKWPALKAQVVECSFKIIKKIEESEAREVLMRSFPVAVASGAEPETSSLGERENDIKRLEEAVEAYRDALKERTRERVPLQWATTQNNLGVALATLGERKSSTKRLEEAAESFSNVLQVDPDNERAYTGAQILYHENLFAFAEAFDLNQAWLERHPDDLGEEANFAEAAFTVGRFAEAEQRLAALVDRPNLTPENVIALRALEICSLVALDRPDTLRAKLDVLGDLLKGDELATTWTFTGTRHFIGGHPELHHYPGRDPAKRAGFAERRIGGTPTPFA